MIWLVFLASIGGYLLGSIPFGVVVSRWLGSPDPRLAGSRNVGFTNVLRVGGKKAGILTLIGDIGKARRMDRYSTVPPRIRYSARGSGVYRWASPFRLSEFQRREGRGHGVRSCTGSRPLGRAHPHGYLDRSGLIVEIFFRGCTYGLWIVSNCGAAVSSILALRVIRLSSGYPHLVQAHR